MVLKNGLQPQLQLQRQGLLLTATAVAATSTAISPNIKDRDKTATGINLKPWYSLPPKTSQHLRLLASPLTQPIFSTKSIS